MKGQTRDPNTLKRISSKTAGDRDSVQRNTSRKWHACGLSNGHVTWPMTSRSLRRRCC